MTDRGRGNTAYGLLVVGIGFVILGLLVIASTVAWGHDWYESQCCSGHDCRPAKAGEVRRTDRGWMVHNATPNAKDQICPEVLIPFNDPRIHQSLDVNAHLCFRWNLCDPLCFYKPDPAT